MLQVLQHISERAKAYDSCSLYSFLRDNSIPYRQRLALYPCLAYWIMSFSDINKFLLKALGSTDAVQERINIHAAEDETHFAWYLEDYEKLGFNTPQPPSQFLQFLWGDETRNSRMLVYRLAALISCNHQAVQLAVIECLERGGNGFFSLLAPIAAEAEAELGVELRYCGMHHLRAEDGHIIGSDTQPLESIELDDVTRQACLRAVDQVWDLLLQVADEVYAYAKAHPVP